ncbi:MAG: hypothetical protein AAFZ17_18985 [Cyanobacteria bacterium J06650_10]
MTQTSRLTRNKMTLVWFEKQSYSLRALAMTFLFLSGTAVPAIAQPQFTQPKQTAKFSQQPTKLPTNLSIVQPVESAQFEAVELDGALAADIEQIVAQMIAVETQHWSPAEKAALQTMEQVGLKESEIAVIATLSAADLHTKMKTDKKLAQLSAAGISSETVLKLAPTLLLSRYLFNIGRAAAWGGVVAAIRAADFDYGVLSSALVSGNTRQFMSALRAGLPNQTSFLNVVGSAATFACGSATLDFTPGLCTRFASGMQKIFNRIGQAEAAERTEITRTEITRTEITRTEITERSSEQRAEQRSRRPRFRLPTLRKD